ncbi:Fe-S cluster containing protein [Synechococcus sp. RSCCF101]|nr:Fe-S cluster containing protein [Synechococcus sp. RSCCF101]
MRRGTWVKVIAGASNEDLPAIADLCALFAVAGADALDVAADPAVVAAARRGLDWARVRSGVRPWLMVSLSDGEDLHFRKAGLEPSRCPAGCPRPCERVCPALAISFPAGVDANRCYGCGRCLPACPHGLIEARSTSLPAASLPGLLSGLRPDAVEIHTAAGRGEAFSERLVGIAAAGLPLRRLSVSCGPGSGRPQGIEAFVGELWDRHRRLRPYPWPVIWQLDGRPMSGDVGDGMARAAVTLWQALRRHAPPGPLQLAGGTGPHSHALLGGAAATAPRRHRPAGVAFGGSARSLLQPLLLEAHRSGVPLRDHPRLSMEALARARSLLRPWKPAAALEGAPAGSWSAPAHC